MRTLTDPEIAAVNGGDDSPPAPTCETRTENGTSWTECSCPEGYSIDYQDNFGEIVVYCKSSE